jgi:hypothetical protein
MLLNNLALAFYRTVSSMVSSSIHGQRVGCGREDSFNLCLFGVDMIKFIVCYRDW